MKALKQNGVHKAGEYFITDWVCTENPMEIGNIHKPTNPEFVFEDKCVFREEREVEVAE
jgi:hypothetical protein